MDGLECSQPLGAEHLPVQTSQVELDMSLWERDDGPIGEPLCEEDLMLQQQADKQYELGHLGDRRATMPSS